MSNIIYLSNWLFFNNFFLNNKICFLVKDAGDTKWHLVTRCSALYFPTMTQHSTSIHSWRGVFSSKKQTILDDTIFDTVLSHNDTTSYKYTQLKSQEYLCHVLLCCIVVGKHCIEHFVTLRNLCFFAGKQPKYIQFYR